MIAGRPLHRVRGINWNLECAIENGGHPKGFETERKSRLKGRHKHAHHTAAAVLLDAGLLAVPLWSVLAGN
jgi:hypothetical protein